MTMQEHSTFEFVQDDIAIDISSTDHELQYASSGMHFNADGTVYLKLVKSSKFTKYVVKAGSYLPYSVKAVRKSGTTLTATDDMIAVY